MKKCYIYFVAAIHKTGDSLNISNFEIKTEYPIKSMKDLKEIENYLIEAKCKKTGIMLDGDIVIINWKELEK